MYRNQHLFYSTQPNIIQKEKKMSTKKILTILCMVAVAIAAIGCAPAASEAPSAEPAIIITGKVDNESSWTMDELQGIEAMEAERENKEGAVETYKGVSINALLDKAGVAGDAVAIVLVADDGYEAEVDLAELKACENCIFAFRTNGGLSAVLPGFSGKAQVKGVIKAEVK